MVKALQDNLHEFLASVKAEIPAANPTPDTSRPFLETRQKPGAVPKPGR